ncbi:MAG: 30S ribosomal protein S16 [Phycisphaerae bacterium]
MALTIRMKRLGRRNRPFWRICATDKRAARDGRVVEELGHYDPHQDNADKVKIHRDRVVHWLKHGAQPSKTVAELLGHLGLDAKGNEITPKPWPKKKPKAPPPKAAERVAAEKAEAERAEADTAATETAETPPEQDEADAGGEENASA